ncbi:MAG: hypothetical protein HN576_11550 [Bacteriovoracaceae bacterium]|nr:hypothetical protein [Bacteriovoracaceae bacterium]
MEKISHIFLIAIVSMIFLDLKIEATEVPKYCDFTRNNSLNQNETDCVYTINNPNTLIRFANTFVAEETKKEFEQDVMRKIAKKHLEDLLNHHFYSEKDLQAGDISIKKWVARSNFVNLIKEKGLDIKCSALGGEAKDFITKITTAKNMLEVSKMFHTHSSSSYLAREIQKAVIVENLMHLGPETILEITRKYPEYFNMVFDDDKINFSEYQIKLIGIFNKVSSSGSKKIKTMKALVSASKLARARAAVSLASMIGSGSELSREGQKIIAERLKQEQKKILKKLSKVCSNSNTDYYSHPDITSEIIKSINGTDGKSLRKIYNLKRNNCHKLKSLQSVPSQKSILFQVQRLDREVGELSAMTRAKVKHLSSNIDFVSSPKPGTCYTTAFGSKRYFSDSSFSEFNNQDKKFKNDNGDLEGSYSCEYECIRPNGKKDRLLSVHSDKVKKRNDNGKQFLCLSYNSPSTLNKTTVLYDGYRKKSVYSANGKTMTIDPVNSKSRQLVEWGKKYYPNRIPAESVSLFSNWFN